MRVAILSPNEGREVSALVQGLLAKGVEAVLLTTDTHEPWGMMTALERLSEPFDLVHHCLDLPPLYSRFLDVPVVATVHEVNPKHLPHYQRVQDQVYLIAGPSSPSELRYFSEIRDSGNQAEDYHAVYTRVLEQCKREDHRPWGFYTVLADEPSHKVKRICVYPGKRLSLQRHQRRCEHWHVIEGEAVVTLDQAQLPLGPGQSVDIPFGAIHRIENRSDAPMAFIEVQRGDYFGEDDIERLEDDFGRVI